MASTSPRTDPYWANVVLLLHFDETVAVQDWSDYAHPITLITATVSTTQTKFGASSLFGGSALTQNNQARVLTSAPHLQFGAGQFTVEGWLYFTGNIFSTFIYTLVSQWAGAGQQGWWLGLNNGSLNFQYSTTGSDNPFVGAAWTPSINTWYHIAADRDASNVLRVYLNGAVWASATVAATIWPSTQYGIVCNDTTNSRNVTGYVDEVRVTNGVARYAGAFTAPTAAFPGPSGPTLGSIVSQVGVEVLGATPKGSLVSQAGAELLRSASDLPGSVVSQSGVEVLTVPEPPPPGARITQIGLEALYSDVSHQARVTQAALEVMRMVGEVPPRVRVSQTRLEVLRSNQIPHRRPWVHVMIG